MVRIRIFNSLNHTFRRIITKWRDKYFTWNRVFTWFYWPSYITTKNTYWYGINVKRCCSPVISWSESAYVIVDRWSYVEEGIITWNGVLCFRVGSNSSGFFSDNIFSFIIIILIIVVIAVYMGGLQFRIFHETYPHFNNFIQNP